MIGAVTAKHRGSINRFARAMTPTFLKVGVIARCPYSHNRDLGRVRVPVGSQQPNDFTISRRSAATSGHQQPAQQQHETAGRGPRARPPALWLYMASYS
eukprot:COSAG01_NODE_2963_length_6794_cov_3.981321_5_plen_99_part_00